MKKLKKKVWIGALAASGALTFTACSNRPGCVYGPPPDIAAETGSVTEETEPAAVSEAPAAEASAPESAARQELSDGETAVFQGAHTGEAAAAEETGSDVNGGISGTGSGQPPVLEKKKQNRKSGEKPAEGEPKTFAPEDNIAVCVYGPPEWFEKNEN